jgi:hypothetical protein
VRPRLAVPEQPAAGVERTIIRAVRRVPPRSVRGVLIRVVHEARSPDWSAVAAGQALAAHVEGDVRRLRAARVHLLVASSDRPTVCDERALATIDVAITELEGRPAT